LGGSAITVLSGLESTLGGMRDSDFKYLVTMKKALREIEYYFKIGNIKKNLKVSASQHPEYTKNYENILGEEFGHYIDSFNNSCKYQMTMVSGNTEADKGKKFVLEYSRIAHVEMLEAVQALDLYLSKFTQEIQTNPDDIKDFVKLLEQLEIVAKWFTDKSGDNLAQVFESMDGGLVVDGKDFIIEEKSHYYEKLNKDGTGQVTISGV
jgi:hypothetical protein